MIIENTPRIYNKSLKLAALAAAEPEFLLCYLRKYKTNPSAANGNTANIVNPKIIKVSILSFSFLFLIVCFFVLFLKNYFLK